jgi:hypothetical protein
MNDRVNAKKKVLYLRLTSACRPTPLRGRYRGAVGLCDAARTETDLGKIAARLTRRALGAPAENHDRVLGGKERVKHKGKGSSRNRGNVKVQRDSLRPPLLSLQAESSPRVSPSCEPGQHHTSEQAHGKSFRPFGARLFP